MIQRLAIIGVGLIGGSLARALRRAGCVQEIVGCGRGVDNLKRGVELGVIDRYTTEVAEAVAGADLVFLGTPLGVMRDLLTGIRPHLHPDAIVTDGGSVKSCVLADALAAFGEVPPNLVPGHPIAGTEQSGVEASFAELYQNRRVILTPVERTAPQALHRVTQMWEACGAEVSLMEPARHDDILAATSHLPHLLAYSLVDTLASMRQHHEIFRYAAGGFRDVTRIASSNPLMWRDICLANHEALGAVLTRFAAELRELADALEASQGERLLEIFQRAKTARDRYIDGLQADSEAAE